MEKENKDEEEIRVVGMRCCELLIDPLPGSWKATCCECKKEVWITEMWKGKKIDKIVCDQCCFETGMYKDEDVKLKVTKETLDQFVKWVREYYGDAIIDQSDEDIKLMAIEIIENKLRKEINIAKLEDVAKK